MKKSFAGVPGGASFLDVAVEKVYNVAGCTVTFNPSALHTR